MRSVHHDRRSFSRRLSFERASPDISLELAPGATTRIDTGAGYLLLFARKTGAHAMTANSPGEARAFAEDGQAPSLESAAGPLISHARKGAHFRRTGLERSAPSTAFLLAEGAPLREDDGRDHDANFVFQKENVGRAVTTIALRAQSPNGVSSDFSGR
jgi:hypothetical protein